MSASSDVVIKKGVLEKRGAWSKRWAKRNVTIKGSKLIYDHKVKGGTTEVILTGSKITTTENQTFQFTIETSDGKRLVWRTKTAKSHTSWVNGVRRAAGVCPTRNYFDSSESPVATNTGSPVAAYPPPRTVAVVAPRAYQAGAQFFFEFQGQTFSIKLEQNLVAGQTINIPLPNASRFTGPSSNATSTSCSSTVESSGNEEKMMERAMEESKMIAARDKLKKDTLTVKENEILQRTLMLSLKAPSNSKHCALASQNEAPPSYDKVVAGELVQNNSVASPTTFTPSAPPLPPPSYSVVTSGDDLNTAIAASLRDPTMRRVSTEENIRRAIDLSLKDRQKHVLPRDDLLDSLSRLSQSKRSSNRYRPLSIEIIKKTPLPVPVVAALPATPISTAYPTAKARILSISTVANPKVVVPTVKADLITRPYSPPPPPKPSRSESLSKKKPKMGSPKLLVCPLTKKLFNDPVITKYGFTYDKEAILHYITLGLGDPLQEATEPDKPSTLTSKDCYPNLIVEAAVDDYKQAQNGSRDCKKLAKEGLRLFKFGLSRSDMDMGELPDFLTDPISFEPFENPVCTRYGRTYSRHVIVDVIARSGEDPMCRLPIKNETELISNKLVTAMIKEFKSAGGLKLLAEGSNKCSQTERAARASKASRTATRRVDLVSRTSSKGPVCGETCSSTEESNMLVSLMQATGHQYDVVAFALAQSHQSGGNVAEALFNIKPSMLESVMAITNSSINIAFNALTASGGDVAQAIEFVQGVQ